MQSHQSRQDSQMKLTLEKPILTGFLSVVAHRESSTKNNRTLTATWPRLTTTDKIRANVIKNNTTSESFITNRSQTVNFAGGQSAVSNIQRPLKIKYIPSCPVLCLTPGYRTSYSL